jgi:hypothetical protein
MGARRNSESFVPFLRVRESILGILEVEVEVEVERVMKMLRSRFIGYD